MTTATFTLSQLFNIFLVMCGGLITVSGAIGVIVTIVRKATAPSRVQDDRLDKIEAEVSKIKEKLSKDDERLVSIEEGNRIIMQAILSLLTHGIDGNEINGMKKAKEELTEYLLRR